MGVISGIDNRQLIRLRDNLKEFENEKNKIIEDCAKELSARLLRLVIKKTPVGQKPKFAKKSGKAKGNSGKSKSFLTKEGDILQKYWSGYVGGNLRRGWTVSPPVRSGDKISIMVANPVEYASYVEYGHRQQVGRYVPMLGVKLKKSWVKGKFMLTTSEKEIKKIAPELLDRRIKEGLGKVFDVD